MGKSKFRNSSYGVTLETLLQHFWGLVAGQTILLAISVLILYPVLGNLGQKTLSVVGIRYVTVDNILRFIAHPVTILYLLLAFFLLGVFLLWEMQFHLLYFSQINKGKRVRTFRLLGLSVWRLVKGFVRKNWALIPRVWGIMLLCNLPLIIYLFRKNRMARFLVVQAPNVVFWGIAATVLVVLLVSVLFGRPFLLHHYTLEGQDLKEAGKRSHWKKGQPRMRIAGLFLGWNILLFFGVLLVYIFFLFVAALLVSGTLNQNLALATFITIQDQMRPLVSILIFLFCTGGNFALSVHLFFRYQMFSEEALEEEEDLSVIFGRSQKKIYPKRILLLMAVLIAGTCAYFFVTTLRNGTPLSAINLDRVLVTSHRGFSHSVPENTLPAIEKAIEEQADYVEIDVRLTSDGVPVLLHDASLKRTTGLNEKIWNVTYAEVAQLDAGSWMGDEFTGITIPTLEEVFALAKGQVMLNLDLKYHVDEEGLVEKVVALIEEYDMEYQCVIFSTNFGCLEQVKALNPDIQTGYILYQLYTGLLDNENIDFFSMKSTLVTKEVVDEIHTHGKTIHTWTVNTKAEIERLERLGVDNIITDNPAYAKAVLYESDSDWYLVKLIKVILE